MKNSVVIAGVQWGEFEAADGQKVQWAKVLVLEPNEAKQARGYVSEWYKLKPDLCAEIRDMPGMYEAEVITVRDYKSGMRGFKIVELQAARTPLGMAK